MISGNLYLMPQEDEEAAELYFDRRKARRFQVSDLSNLILDINGRAIVCKIHDISETGAKLETSYLDLPSCFVLDAPSQNLRVLCRKVWSQDGMTGILFLKTRS